MLHKQARGTSRKHVAKPFTQPAALDCKYYLPSALLGQMGMQQNWLDNWARWWNILIKVNSTYVPDHHCHLVLRNSIGLPLLFPLSFRPLCGHLHHVHLRDGAAARLQLPLLLPGLRLQVDLGSPQQVLELCGCHQLWADRRGVHVKDVGKEALRVGMARRHHLGSGRLQRLQRKEGFR